MTDQIPINTERYRFQDFPWLEKGYEQTIDYLSKDTRKGIGVFLQNQGIDAEQLKTLLEVAKKNITLKGLMLDKNNLGDEGCKVLSEFLANDDTLVYLFLENNGISNKGLELLIEGLKQNRSIQSIWIGRNNITDKGVEEFSEFLIQDDRIKEFSIGGRKMTDVGAFCVAKAIHSSDQIKSVHLLDNNIGWEGGRLLAGVASVHSSCDVVEIDSPNLTADQFTNLLGDLASREQRKAFEEAVKNGEEGPWLRSKIMVVGQGRAGKTATVRSMLNLEFNPTLESTVGAAISQSNTKKIDGNSWEKDTGERKVELAVDAASRLAVLKMRKRQRDQAAAFEKQTLKEMIATFKELKDEEERINRKMRQKHENIMPENIQNEINQKYNAKLITNKNAHAEDISFTIWDYGGQRVFYTLHHLFLTKYGLYILVFDMRDVVCPHLHMNEEGYRQKKDKQRQCKEYIEFWLNSVYMHASTAPIIIVGSYLDVVSESADVLEVDAFIKDIVGTRFRDVVASNGALSFFPLSNKNSRSRIIELARMTGGKGATGESNIDTIRDTIEQVARQQDFINQNLSLKWIKCLDQMLDKQDVSFLKYKEVVRIASSCGIQDITEIDNMLKFFHELGMIVHLTSTQHLKEIITIKPQWLIDELSKVIRDKRLHQYNRAELDKKGLLGMYELVLKESIVTSDWLEYLWPKNRVDFLIDLMTRTMLISEWKFGEFENDPAYLVPSLIEREDLTVLEDAKEKLIQFLEEEVDLEEEIKELKEQGVFSDENPEADRNLLNKIFGFGRKSLPRKKQRDFEAGGILDLDQKIDLTKKGIPMDAPEEKKVKKRNLFGRKHKDKVEAQANNEKALQPQEMETIDNEDKQVELPPPLPIGYYAKEKDARRIVFDFRKSFLPNGVFQRLLCLCILKCTTDKKTSIKPKLFKSSAVIEMGDGQVFELCKCQKQIICTVTKDFLVSYKVLQSMMEKLKTDVMGSGLEWDVYLEYCVDEEFEQGYLHSFALFKDARESKMLPWFQIEENIDEIVNKKIGKELEEFINDISFE